MTNYENDKEKQNLILAHFCSRMFFIRTLTQGLVALQSTHVKRERLIVV